MVLTFYPPGTASATEPAPESVSESSLDVEPAPESPSEEEQPAVEPAFVMQPPPEFVETPGSDEEPDGISSAAELLSWLESHKFSGGRAALTGDITVNEFCTFVPYPNMPPLSVETEKHTIFVCADTELLSDGRLTFEGEGGGQGIFHVERDGTLLDGVNVKAVSADGGSQYALWQEEGAGMILGNTFAPCRVSGDIHYARTPLVLDAEHVCVVVEKGGSFWMTVCHGSHMQGERAGSHSGA